MAFAKCWLWLVPLCVAAALPAQNSMRKIRTPPSEIAKRCGSQVNWRTDLDAALLESAKSGKPVFWYVPTVPASPMDRKREIDFYMMSGPFMWPRLIELLNDKFIPVKRVPTRKLAKQHGLLPRKFIEPGFVVLDGATGKELRRLDRITTFHEEWFVRLVAGVVGAKVEKRKVGKAVARLRSVLAKGATDKVQLLDGEGLAPERRAELLFLRGALRFRQGRTAAARKEWATARREHPEHAFAWKCAAELESLGAFVRGFEVHGALPEDVLKAAASARRGTRANAGTYDADALKRRGLAFLDGMMHEDGVFRDSTYDFGGTDSLPNVYAAVTALARLSLVESVPVDAKLPTPKVLRAADALSSKKLNPRDLDEIVWAHAYTIRKRLRLATLTGAGALKNKVTQARIDALRKLQTRSGSIRHEYPNPFATATVLQVLHMAKQQGYKVDQELVDGAVGALLRNRGKTGGFSYGDSSGRRASVPGSAGRMALCEMALYLWGKSDQKRLTAAVAAGFEYHELLAKVRKYDDHAGQYGYGGFFFWFDMLGRTDAALLVKDKKRRAAFLAKQKQIVLSLPEIDGCFVDSHELGRVYGTAMALICLARLERGLTAK